VAEDGSLWKYNEIHIKTRTPTHLTIQTEYSKKLSIEGICTPVWTLKGHHELARVRKIHFIKGERNTFIRTNNWFLIRFYLPVNLKVTGSLLQNYFEKM
jgi:hypothetical protein